MYDNFLKTEQEKQDRIINAAYEVFALYGYKRASTLEIIKKAAISKGILFHYFGSKNNLYFYLYDHGVKFMREELRSHPPSSDFFARMQELAVTKMQCIITKYPYMYDFFVTVYAEKDESVQQGLQQRLSALMSNQSLVTDHIDLTPFRKDVDLHVLSDLIVNFSTSFLQSHLHLPPEDIMRDFQRYLDMLKENFYKEEYL